MKIRIALYLAIAATILNVFNWNMIQWELAIHKSVLLGEMRLARLRSDYETAQILQMMFHHPKITVQIGNGPPAVIIHNSKSKAKSDAI